MENENLREQETPEYSQIDNETSQAGERQNVQETASFEIPEEYLEKDWVKNFEGQKGEELKAGIFKALDEKYSNTPHIPESGNDYELASLLLNEQGEKSLFIEDEALNFFGDKFKELGFSKEQAQNLFKSYLNYGIEEFQKITDADELEKNINTLFNGNKEQRKTVEGLIKEFLPQEDQKIIQDIVPNRVIEMFYKVGKGLVDKYGYQEGTNNANSSSGIRITQADIDNEYNRIASEIEALQHRPHSTEEKTRLQAQLIHLFE